jgi:hypothetical protein
VGAWILPAALAGGITTNVAPVDAATTSLIQYILGYGVVGIVALAFAFRFVVPRGSVEEARKLAREDLERENARLIEERNKAETERDAALKIAQDQIVPLLVSFNSTASSLIPLLQDIVRDRESRRGGST